MLPSQDTPAEQISRSLLGIAKDLAMNLLPLDTILKTHGINREQFETLKDTPHFQALLAEQIRAWEAADNAESRVRLRALTAVELAMPELFARMHDPREPLSAKSDVFKSFQKIAGLLDRAPDAAASRVMININLGAAREPVTIDAQVTPSVTGDVVDA